MGIHSVVILGIFQRQKEVELTGMKLCFSSACVSKELLNLKNLSRKTYLSQKFQLHEQHKGHKPGIFNVTLTALFIIFINLMLTWMLWQCFCISSILILANC